MSIPQIDMICRYAGEPEERRIVGIDRSNRERVMVWLEMTAEVAGQEPMRVPWTECRCE